jgi:alpha-D-xyloside xylohydrolase
MKKMLFHISVVFLGMAFSLPAGRSAPVAVLSVQKDSDGVTLKMTPGTLKLQVFSPRIIRVVYGPGDSVPVAKSFAVAGRPIHAHWTVTEKPEEICLRTGELEARVSRASGAVGFYDTNGQPVLLEKTNGGRTLKPARIGGIDTLRSEQDFMLSPGEAIYGLGQHQQGLMNYRGSTVHLQQENREVAVPVLVSSRGYGVLWDNPAVTEVNVGAGQYQIIPSAQLYPEDGQPGGLTARYYRGQNFETPVSTNTDAQVDFNWSEKPPAGLEHDHYSVRWTGFVQAKQGGDYTFLATADDGVRLWIDDRQVVNDWNSRAVQTFTAKVQLEADTRHRIRLEYYQEISAAMVKLAWRLPANEAQLSWSSEAADAIDYYFMYGPELDDVIADYRELTGAAPMFGKWAWGFWQCKERYRSQQELLDVAGKYRSRHIPLDGIIQDWQYWTPNPWGSHQFDTNRYPDPVRMMRDLHAENVHALISVWAKFDVDSPNADELRKAGGLYSQVIPYVFPPGKGQWYDAFNPVARNLYWRQISRPLFADGLDGWWLDASEPELSGNWGEYRDFKTAAGSGAKVFNAYPLLHTTGVYEGQRAEHSDQRVFILTRSAYAGQQRNAAVTWSGDIHGTWDVFARQIPAGLNFSLSGIPYWNTDTGGFFSGKPSDPKYAELFTRWFQFSAFCPMFRVHGTGNAKEMWHFNEATQKILIHYDQLRYHLLPYIYSVAWKVTSEGYTMMRPLVMDFRHDTNTFNIADQFLLGPALLVNPVIEPGANSRNVYLPAGANWTDFWTGQTYAGGQTISAVAPIETMPLFARAGSILPCGPAIEYAMQSVDPMELRVYRGADGAFALYEDEGDNYHYEKGIHATIPISWDEAKHTLTIGKRQGHFPGMLKRRTFRIVWVSPDHGTGIPSTEKADAVVSYNGSELKISSDQKETNKP